MGGEQVCAETLTALRPSLSDDQVLSPVTEPGGTRQLLVPRPLSLFPGSSVFAQAHRFRFAKEDPEEGNHVFEARVRERGECAAHRRLHFVSQNRKLLSRGRLRPPEPPALDAV